MMQDSLQYDIIQTPNTLKILVWLTPNGLVVDFSFHRINAS